MGVGGSVDGWLCGDALNCRLGGRTEVDFKSWYEYLKVSAQLVLSCACHCASIVYM